MRNIKHCIDKKEFYKNETAEWILENKKYEG